MNSGSLVWIHATEFKYIWIGATIQKSDQFFDLFASQNLLGLLCSLRPAGWRQGGSSNLMGFKPFSSSMPAWVEVLNLYKNILFSSFKSELLSFKIVSNFEGSKTFCWVWGLSPAACQCWSSTWSDSFPRKHRLICPLGEQLHQA